MNSDADNIVQHTLSQTAEDLDNIYDGEEKKIILFDYSVSK